MELSESALVQRDSRVVIRPKTIKAFGGLTGVKHTGHTGCIAHKMFNLWWEVSFKVTTLSTIWIKRRFFSFFFFNCCSSSAGDIYLSKWTQKQKRHINSLTVSDPHNNYSSVDLKIMTGLRKRHRWNSGLLRVLQIIQTQADFFFMTEVKFQLGKSE